MRLFQHYSLKPSPVAGMSRKQLARWAFDQAVARLDRLPIAERRGKFDALRGAYNKRRDDIEQAAFLSRALGGRLGNEMEAA